jgi:hypothetical protein
MQHAVVGGVRDERHTVGVEVQHRSGVQRDVVLRQSNRDSAAQHDLAGATQPLPPGFHLLGLDGFRAVPLEPEQHRGQRSVAAASCRERAVQLDPEVGNSGQHARRLEFVDEVCGCPHRADGMRTRGTDADLEELEHTDGH